MRFKSWVWLMGLWLNLAVAAPEREIAITFDDLPAVDGKLAQQREVTRKLLTALKVQGGPAIGFVNEGKLFVRGEMDARTALLRQWLEAGHGLGNHTFSHIDISKAPVEAYVDDVVRGETVTRMLLAERDEKLRYFRHTQLRTGPTEAYRSQLNTALAARGYVTAPVTVDNNGYVFNRAYVLAGQRQDATTQKKLVAEYVIYMEGVIAHFEALSDRFLGRPMKHTLLLHANDLNADHFGALAQMLKGRGYRFITLNDALTDPAYQLPEAQSTRGISWLHRWMLAKGLPMDEEPAEAAWVRDLAR